MDSNSFKLLRGYDYEQEPRRRLIPMMYGVIDGDNTQRVRNILREWVDFASPDLSPGQTVETMHLVVPPPALEYIELKFRITPNGLEYSE